MSKKVHLLIEEGASKESIQKAREHRENIQNAKSDKAFYKALDTAEKDFHLLRGYHHISICVETAIDFRTNTLNALLN